MKTNTVESADGTTIAYDQHGTGQPIICLHGTGVTRDVWAGFVDAFATDAMLVVPDRRGRGDSGDADEYSFEREQDDVRAVAAATAGETDPILFGSSFGGLLAMATAETLDVDGLVLNEPPLPAETVEMSEREPLAARMDARLQAGDRQGAVELFFIEAVGVDEIERLPIWPECVALAETMVREAYIVGSFRLDDVAVSDRTLLLTGEHSPGYLGDGVALLADRIPGAQTVEIEGAGHASIVTAPQRVGAAVREFL